MSALLSLSRDGVLTLGTEVDLLGRSHRRRESFSVDSEHLDSNRDHGARGIASWQLAIQFDSYPEWEQATDS